MSDYKFPISLFLYRQMLKQLREIGIADRNQLIGNLHPFMLDIIDVADGNDIRAMNPAKRTL